VLLCSTAVFPFHLRQSFSCQQDVRNGVIGPQKGATRNDSSLQSTSLDQRNTASMHDFLSMEVFERLLQSPMGKHSFRNYLKQEVAEENLDFWYKVCVLA
jgi:tRNA U38,U39,U40 pseudouridine synthase TruA